MDSACIGLYLKRFEKIPLTTNINNADGEIVATTKLYDADVAKGINETFIWTHDTPIDGDFIIEIINNCPSGSSSKDRAYIWELTWPTCANAN